MNKPVTRENVISYLNVRLGKKVIFYNYERMEWLLKEFSVKNIRSLETFLKDTHCEEKLESYQRLLTADKIISYILIIYDSDKFFKITGDSIVASSESFEFLNEFVDIKKQCEKYNVKVEIGGKD